MVRKEYIQWMEEAGWTVDRGNGECFYSIELDDRRLMCMGGFSQTTHEFIFEDQAKVGFLWYTEVIRKIEPSFGDWTWLAGTCNSRFSTPGRAVLVLLLNALMN